MCIIWILLLCLLLLMEKFHLSFFFCLFSFSFELDLLNIPRWPTFLICAFAVWPDQVKSLQSHIMTTSTAAGQGFQSSCCSHLGNRVAYRYIKSESCLLSQDDPVHRKVWYILGSATCSCIHKLKVQGS